MTSPRARGLAATIVLVGLPAFFGTFGCSTQRSQTEAREFADRYYTLLQDGRLDEALDLCEPTFFERTPREEWVANRRMVDERLGAIESFTMLKWTMEIMPNGTFVTFVYDVVYERGTSQDTITVVDPVKQPGFRVFGHHVRSDRLQAPT